MRAFGSKLYGRGYYGVAYVIRRIGVGVRVLRKLLTFRANPRARSVRVTGKTPKTMV
jgi:hypothetical protein